MNLNSVDPDQMLHSVVSDLVLHCLPISLLWDARLNWVKMDFNRFKMDFYRFKNKIL